MECEPVGIQEIAERLHRTRWAVDTWLRNDRAASGFPAPKWKVGGRPCWNWPDVEAWARKTNRLP